MAHPVHVTLRWLTPDEGGRRRPIQGQEYAPTARFVGETHDLFSVVLSFVDPQQPNPEEADLRLLFPDLTEVQKRLLPGSRLEITEGAKVVAHCQVVSKEQPLSKLSNQQV